jgi:hypothetical protein
MAISGELPHLPLTSSDSVVRVTLNLRVAELQIITLPWRTIKMYEQYPQSRAVTDH